MPQEIDLPLNSTTEPPSTSHDINPTNAVATECEKENFAQENQFAESRRSDQRLVSSHDETILQANGITSETMPDLFDIVLQEQRLQQEETRPRQYGRRSNPMRISSLAAGSLNHSPAVILF